MNNPWEGLKKEKTPTSMKWRITWVKGWMRVVDFDTWWKEQDELNTQTSLYISLFRFFLLKVEKKKQDKDSQWLILFSLLVATEAHRARERSFILLDHTHTHTHTQIFTNLLFHCTIILLSWLLANQVLISLEQVFIIKG